MQLRVNGLTMNHLSTWIQLLTLARQRLRSDRDYQRFQQFQAQRVFQSLEEVGVAFRNKLVLDVGSGHGGYSVELASRGASVLSLDRFTLPKIQHNGFQPVTADCIQIPLSAESIDFVFCASLIEHVQQPERLLMEIKRILSPGGLCYLSFPPFYSLNGGHQFKPYHLLGERIAVRIKSGKWKGYADAFGEWGLYRLTIHSARQMLNKAGFNVIRLTTRFSPLNFAKVPVLGEFLCWHVEFLVSKTVSLRPQYG